jgi:uncharacterized protein with HEPN domain
MSDRRDQDYLGDIVEAIEEIADFTTGMSLDDFMRDAKTQRAVVRDLEIIGEAAKALSEDVRSRYPEVPWRGLAGVRDKMIHHYFGLDHEIIWTIAADELPLLLPKLQDACRREFE